MTYIGFNVAANVSVALFFIALPLVFILIGSWQRHKGHESKGWKLAKRFWYLPLLAPLILYFAVIYQWLFHDQFYWIKLAGDDTWQLDYYLPTRHRTLRTNEIKSVEPFTGDLWTCKMARLVIVTHDGRRFRSKRVGLADRDFYMNLLNEAITDKPRQSP